MRPLDTLCVAAALVVSARAHPLTHPHPHSLSNTHRLREKAANPLGEWMGPIAGLEAMGNFSLSVKTYSGSLTYYSYAVTLTPPSALGVAPIHCSALIAEVVNPKETGRTYSLDCLCEKESSVCQEGTVTRGVYNFISPLSKGGEGISVRINPPHFPFRPLAKGDTAAGWFVFRRP